MSTSSECEVQNSSSDEEQEELIFDACMAGLIAGAEHYQKRCIKQPKHTSNYKGWMWIKDIIEGHDALSQEMFRMEKKVFLHLCKILSNNYGLTPSRNMEVDEMVGTFLYTLAHGSVNRNTQARFSRSGETISRRFEDVMQAVLRMSMDTIKPADPNFSDVHPKILHYQRYYPFFRNCIGAIDGTHVKCVVPSSSTARFVGRKGYTTQNILAICDWDMCFTFVWAGWEGTSHDSRIFHEARTTEALNFPHPHQLYPTLFNTRTQSRERERGREGERLLLKSFQYPLCPSPFAARRESKGGGAESKKRKPDEGSASFSILISRVTHLSSYRRREASKSMEQKAWLWRKKSSEKTIIINEKSDLTLMENEQEKEKTEETERSFKELNEQLSYARSESNTKDDLLAKQAKVAAEAIAGWKKAEAEAVSFKQDLDVSLLQKRVAEERMVNMDSSLKKCIQQLLFLGEENQRTVSDTAIKISIEQEKARVLEESLGETNKRLAKLLSENNNLQMNLEDKEKLVLDLSDSKSQLEENFALIVARLDSSQKVHASLKYEICMLQKELEIRNEEREFDLKSAEAVHKQHLGSIKKISKLETECQRLRLMVQKHLPGPAALAKMRIEVEMLESSNAVSGRKKSNLFIEDSRIRDFMPENTYGAVNKTVTSLVERLRAVEGENEILKEALVKKNSELQSSRKIFACTASKLSQAEAHLEELSKGQVCLELAKSSPVFCDLPLGSIYGDGYNEDSISCSESWGSALISDLEHFRTGKAMTPSCRTPAASELSLMDDFVEMEKLAIVCMDKPSEISCGTSRESGTYAACKGSNPIHKTGKELVPVDDLSDSSRKNHQTKSSCISFEKNPVWIEDILMVILRHHRRTQKSLDAILEEVKVALDKRGLFVNRSPDDIYIDGNKCRKHPTADSDTSDGSFSTRETSNQLCSSEIGKSLLKLIELIEGILCRCIKNSNRQHIMCKNNGGASSCGKYESLTGYVAHAFMWESFELSRVLQSLINVCNDLLYGKADFKIFAVQLALALDWITNQCLPLQDVSNIKEMMKHFDGNESHSGRKFEAKADNSSVRMQKEDASEEHKFGSSFSLTASKGLFLLSEMEEMESKLKDENKSLVDEIINMGTVMKCLEGRLESTNAKNETLISQHGESKEIISKLEVELASLRESIGLVEDQLENEKLINADLDMQFTVAKVELNEVRQMFSTLEVELEDKSNCCDELEATCLELQLQLESVHAKETPRYSLGREEKQLRTDWEITAASSKLAECQETILSLGKQLKSLASPRDAALFDKVMYTPDAGRLPRRTLLLDHMQADAKSGDTRSPQTKEIICDELQISSGANPQNLYADLLHEHEVPRSHENNISLKTMIQNSPMKLPEKFQASDESNQHRAEATVGELAIVPKRRKGSFGLLRKLLSRRKKENSQKLKLPIGP